MKKVLLFLPAYSGQPLGPPVGLLCLASSLRRSDIPVEVIDAAIIPNYLKVIENKLDDALCFGVSLLTGPMIEGAIEVSSLVRTIRPDIPIIYGGWHPSLLAEQTLQESFVDAIVRHQGEMTFLEVVQRIMDGRGFANVSGCSFKVGGLIHHNPDRPVVPLNTLPQPAYDLVDFDAYEKAGGERKLPYASSVGCPYGCSYCTDAVFYGRRFNARAANRVIEDVTTLTKKYRLRNVALLDSNFLVDGRRAIQIAQGFLDSELGFHWTFQTSTDLMCRLSDDEVRLLGDSGVRHIGFGVESGSYRVLSMMNKPHQKIPDAYEAARKCQLAGIRVTFNLILGFPGEQEHDLHQTFRAMGDIASQFENVTFSANIFTPYPGIPIWPELRALGVKEPLRLESWTGLALGANVLPWLDHGNSRKISKAIAHFSLCNDVTKTMMDSTTTPYARWLFRAVRKSLHFRLQHHFFGWPLERLLFEGRTRSLIGEPLFERKSSNRRLGESC